MGTTAEKLTYLNDTKGLLKDSINSLGGEITSQTTFRQYATELDNIYASLPKVSGTGSILSLTPTLKGRLGITPKGDTYQFSTQGYQLLKLNDKEPSTPAGLTEYSTINREITLKGTTNSSGNLTLYFDNLTLPAGDYTLVAYLTNTVPSNSSQVWLRKRNENITGLNLWGGLKRVKNFTLDEETTILGGANNSYLYVNGNISFDTKIKLMILSGTYTVDNVPDWEEYTNGASPNPSYPQNIQYVTGLQAIDITGKNIEDFNNIIYKEYNSTISRTTNQITVVGSTQSYASCQFEQINLQLKPNTTYTFSAKIKSTTNTSGSLTFVSSGLTDNNTQQWGTQVSAGNTSYVTFTTPSTISATAFIGLYTGGTNNEAVFTDIQLEQGDTATTYEPYTGNTYEVNLGKNIFDDTIAQGVVNVNGFIVIPNRIRNTKFIKVEPNKTYSLSFKTTNEINQYNISYFTNASFPRYSETGWVNSINTSFTIPNGINYILLTFSKSNGQNIVPTDIYDIQIEKGPTPTTFSPYFTPIELNKIGTYEDFIFKNEPNNPNYDSSLTLNSWYITKNIGKVVLNGSETWETQWNGDNIHGWRTTIPNLKQTTSGSQSSYVISDYYETRTQDENFSTGSYGISNRTNQSQIIIKNNDITSQNDFITWLGTHNVEVLYQLATPIYEVITNTELINQLETLYNAKSKNGTTNINVTSEDLSMILNVSALKGE